MAEIDDNFLDFIAIVAEWWEITVNYRFVK